MLSDKQRHEVEDLFRAAGYARPLRVARVVSDDERIFAVEGDARACLPSDLIARLQQALGRKVWIVAGANWSDVKPLR